MTEFRTEIVKLGPIEKHPNADTLSITQVLGGYPCILKTGEFKEGDFATYVPVDALVPIKHEFFAFLDDKKHEFARIKARKLRGIFSMGLLVPAIPGAMEGEDVTEQLGIKKYERPGDREYVANHDKTHKERRSETWHFEKRVWAIGVSLGLLFAASLWPLGLLAFPLAMLASYAVIKRNRQLSKRPTIPFYDIEGYRKYKDIFEDGEEVWISEKIHGCQGKYIHTGKRFHVSSRTVFRPKGVKLPQVDGYQPTQDLWWTVAEKYDLENKLKPYPNIVLFGEVYGAVQDLRYGVPESEGVRFAAFDAMYTDSRTYMNAGDFLEFCRKIDVPVVPTLYWGAWSKDLASMSEGKSVLPKADHVREGIVIKPTTEKRDNRIGRKFLKMAGEGYLTRKSDQ